MASEISTALDSELLKLIFYKTFHPFQNHGFVIIIIIILLLLCCIKVILEVPTVLFCSIVGVKWLVYAYIVIS